MDNAVALVETYLRVNGYFTVTEFPVIERSRGGNYRTATDLDILAFRFPAAGRLVTSARQGGRGPKVYAPDPELGCPSQQGDMLIGEVKEGHANLNQGARDPAVLEAVLTRFGCCRPSRVSGTVKNLMRDGRANTDCGHMVHLVAFGSLPPASKIPPCRVITLGHVERFLTDYIREHWEIVRQIQFKELAFGFLLLLEKARQGLQESV